MGGGIEIRIEGNGQQMPIRRSIGLRQQLLFGFREVCDVPGKFGNGQRVKRKLIASAALNLRRAERLVQLVGEPIIRQRVALFQRLNVANNAERP